MRVKIRLFAGLREAIGFDERDVDISDGQTLGEVWASLNPGKDMPSEVLMAINKDYAHPDAEVRDGDEIAFFPPVTGG